MKLQSLAVYLKYLYPEIVIPYINLCRRYKDEPSLILGTIQFIKIDQYLYVINIFSQMNYGLWKQHTDYDIISSDVKREVHIPYKIGCGLGVGDWSTVYSIICDVFGETDISVKIYKFEE